jgi:hypothetical protein
VLEGLVELTVGAEPVPGAGVEVPHAAKRKVKTRALHRRVLRRETMRLQSNVTQVCGRGNAFRT